MAENISPRTGHQAAFHLPVEILDMVASHTLNKRTLQNLCLVNRYFNLVFSPHLYSDMTIVNHTTEQIERCAYGNNNLCHVRRLSIHMKHNVDASVLLSYMFCNMPELRTFEWDGFFIDRDAMDDLGNYCRKVTTLAVLLKRGKTVVPYAKAAKTDPPKPLCDSTLFQCLERLTLGDSIGNLYLRREPVVGILAHAVRLRHLTLGSRKRRGYSHSTTVLPHLCQKFRATGATPLRLRGLRLAQDVRLLSRLETDNAAWLGDMIDVSCLEEVHLPLASLTDDPKFVPWAALHPDRAPRLRRVSVMRPWRPTHQPVPDYIRRLMDASSATLNLERLSQMCYVQGGPAAGPEFLASSRAPATQDPPLAERFAALPNAAAVRTLFVLCVGRETSSCSGPWAENMGPYRDIISCAAALPALENLVVTPSAPQSRFRRHDGEECYSLADNAVLCEMWAWAFARADSCRLRVVKFGRHAWEIERDAAGTVRRLVPLDRSEQEAMGCLESPEHAYPGFSASVCEMNSLHVTKRVAQIVTIERR